MIGPCYKSRKGINGGKRDEVCVWVLNGKALDKSKGSTCGVDIIFWPFS
jgi:hypothetical protein